MTPLDLEKRTHFRREEDRRLFQHAQNYRMLADTVQDYAIFTVDLQGRVTSWDAMAQRLYGYEPEMILGHSAVELLAAREREADQLEPVRQRVEQEGPVREEGWRMRRDSSRFWAEVLWTALREPDGSIGGYAAVTRDLTDRGRVSRQLADAMPYIVWTAATDGSNLLFNRRWFEYTALSPEQSESWGWALIVHPDDLQSLMDAWDSALSQGHGYEMQCRLRRGDGFFRWHLLRLTPVREESGAIRQWVGTATDVHEQKRIQDKLETAARALTASEERLAELNRNLEQQVAERTEELRRKEEELQQTRKLEALGQLAGGVAHDFNNLLTGILGIVEQLHQDLTESDPHRAELSEVLRAGQRAFVLTKQLLAFGRRQVAAPAVLDINAVIQELEKMLHRLIREDIRLVTQLKARPSSIRIDRGQLEQILINLVVNARDAMPQGGTLLLETHQILATRTYPFDVELAPGPYVKLSVIDSGVGMDEVTLKRAFEPFFSTKGKERGTGLGLSTVYGIVKQNGGAITLHSEVGRGTRCDIYLPAVKGEAEPAAAESVPVETSQGGNETILVVEDEDLVRRVVSNSLRKKGYRVLEARHGQEALEISRRHQEPIDLVITDVVMPEMNGRQLAEKMKQLRPKTAILYMSGYAPDIVDSKGMLPAGTPFIEKPALVHTLTRKVREVLDSRPA